MPRKTGSLLVAELKRTLREQGLTYAQIARSMKLSLPTIKRMFSKEDFTLARFERICELAGCSLTELAARARERSPPVRQLTLAQERQIVSDPRLLLVTWLVMNHQTLQDILRDYSLTEPEVLKAFFQLDRLKVIELQPGNRVRLLISRHFSWRPGGPVQRFIYDRMLRDFLSSSFAAEDEEFWFHGGELSEGSIATLKRALRTAARECTVILDGEKAPREQRHGTAFVIAMRRWNYSGFKPFER